MQKIKWMLVAPVLALLLAATPGGFPSKPTFQTVTINGTGATAALAIGANNTGGAYVQETITNTSTVSGDSARLTIQSGANNIQFGICNQNQSTLCKMVGGPTTPSSWIDTFAAIPMCFGTGNNVYMCMDGTTGGLTVGNAQPTQQGNGTINVSTGYFLNGIRVNTMAAVKPANTNRSIAATITNDPDLQIASLPAGTYHFVLSVSYSCANTTMGLAGNVNFSGTLGASHYSGELLYASVIAPIAPTIVSFAVANTQISNAPGTCGSGTNGDEIQASGDFVASTSGTLAFGWAQQVSNAGNLTVYAASSLLVTRLL